MDRLTRIAVRNQDSSERINNFKEVCYGYSQEEAIREASRCIKCKNPICITGCPVNINIPGFIDEISKNDIKSAADILFTSSKLAGVCGRVCPQEEQCEIKCVLGNKGDSVAIGKLERYVADWARNNNYKPSISIKKIDKKIAVIGSGPAGITCAAELAELGYDVTIFEGLHKAGGVLVYGIPEFRLPNEIVEYEIDSLKELGVKIEKNIVIGRTITIDELFNKGYEAVFIGTGAGLPVFLNIKGENLNGVFSANEFLTRNNLMLGYDDKYDTPISIGKRVAVIGGGNVAMDAARTARRLGARTDIIYRRTEKELPAREEEIQHGMEEGIDFRFLTNIKEIIGDKNNRVKQIRCIKMKLGDRDDSNRRRPVEVKGSDFYLEYDTVIMALGNTPNPLVVSTTDGLKIDKYQCILVDENGMTSRDRVFAGGDIVTGAATVILAMGAGKKAAKSIDSYLS